jgi:Leucine-rich repeat (LRR) protein
MKIVTNKKMSSRIFNRAPINFWEPEKWKKIPQPKPLTKIVFAMRSNMILQIKRVTHTKSISNLSFMVLLSNGSNSWKTSMSSFVAMDWMTTVWHTST